MSDEPTEREVWESTLRSACRSLKREFHKSSAEGQKPLGLHSDLLLAVAEVVTASNALDRLDDV